VFLLRNNPSLGGTIDYPFDNVAFFNNIIDSLAGEEDFLLTRSRRISHSTLNYVEETTEAALDEVIRSEQEYENQFTNEMISLEQEVEAALKPIRDSIADLEKRKTEGEAIDQAALDAKINLYNQTMQEQLAKQQRQQEQFSNDLNEKKRAIRLDAELEVQRIQRSFKLAAVVLPVIPPLLLGLIVFARRRLREREGISKARRLR
jgi:ABC-2 type transport system permease protein